MKFAVIGSRYMQGIIERLRNMGCGIDLDSPDFVITGGGDGSILYGERIYPGVPKIPIRLSDHGLKCIYTESEIEKVILKIKDGKYDIKEELKLGVIVRQKYYHSFSEVLNEVQLHNQSPIKAIRFSVYVNDNVLFEDIIGDGVIVATPFGSTAYFSSVGGEEFDKGIGIALNNPHRFKGGRYGRYEIVDIGSKINIEVHRDEGLLLFDNDSRIINVKEGDDIEIKVSENVAKFVMIKDNK